MINSACFEAVVVTNSIPQDKHMRECEKIQVRLESLGTTALAWRSAIADRSKALMVVGKVS